MAEVEAMIEPDCIGDDVWREAVAFIRIHDAILTISAVNLATPFGRLTCHYL